ncbi:MAG: S-layer homology domain-containing protein [Thermotaleaceae bacterium]
MAKRNLCHILVLILFLTIMAPSYAASTHETIPLSMERVVKNGYFGVGGLNLERTANRAEFATIAVRFQGITDEAVKMAAETGPYRDTSDFQGGWARYHIGMAYKQGLMFGTGPDTFNPGGSVTYIQLLAVMLRLLGYQDGEDFHRYPEDYYTKAQALGLADPTIGMHTRVTREVVGVTMEKTLDLELKHSSKTLAEKLGIFPLKESATKSVGIKTISFTTHIVGNFSGQLTGRDSFEGYRIGLYPQGDKKSDAYGEVKVDSTGIFNITAFPIGLIEKLSGYQYKVYDPKGSLILQDNL